MKLFQKIKEERSLPNFFHEANKTLLSKHAKKKKKTHEKMLIIPGQKENSNQNHTKIPPHSC
jgi:hypothetical protein